MKKAIGMVVALYLAIAINFFSDLDLSFAQKDPGDPAYIADVDSIANAVADAKIVDVGAIDSATVEDLIADSAAALRGEMPDSAAVVAGDTATILRAEMPDSAARVVFDTSAVLRGEISDTADVVRGEITDTADVLRAEALDSAAVASGDTADILRAEMLDSAAVVSGDTATILRAEMPDSAARVVFDTSAVLRGEISDTADVVRGEITDTADVLRAEMIDSAGTLFSDSLDILRAEMPDSAAVIAGDTANILRTEMPDSAARVSGDTAAVVRTEMREEMSDTSRAAASDSISPIRIRIAGLGDTYIFPADDGLSGYVLKSDGAGNTTWQVDAGGGLQADTVVIKGIIDDTLTLYTIIMQGLMSDTADVLRDESKDSASVVIGDSLAVVWDSVENNDDRVDTIFGYLTFSGGHLGFNAIDLPGELPDGWADNAASRFFNIRSASINYDAGIGIHRSDSTRGIDVWQDGNTGDVYIDNKYDNDAGDIIFRTKTLGTPVIALVLTGAGLVKPNNAYSLPTSDGSAGQILQTDGSGTTSWGAADSSLWWATGFSGTVAAGRVAYADSNGNLLMAAYDNVYLNRTLRGFGTGVAGKLQIAGPVYVPAATKIGITYYIGPGGSVLDARPDARNVWDGSVGRCFKVGWILIDFGPLRRRI